MDALSLVEKGWAGARQVSIELAKRDVPVCHLVKGQLPSALLRILTPYRGMTIRGIPRPWFRMLAWAYLVRAQVRGNGSLILVDNQRTSGWVDRWFPTLRERLVLIQETPQGSPKLFLRGTRVDLSAVLPARAA